MTGAAGSFLREWGLMVFNAGAVRETGVGKRGQLFFVDGSDKRYYVN
jgi:hypothetical protein